MYIACCCFYTAASPRRRSVFSSGGLFCHSRRWGGRVGVLEVERSRISPSFKKKKKLILCDLLLSVMKQFCVCWNKLSNRLICRFVYVCGDTKCRLSSVHTLANIWQQLPAGEPVSTWQLLSVPNILFCTYQEWQVEQSSVSFVPKRTF